MDFSVFLPKLFKNLTSFDLIETNFDQIHKYLKRNPKNLGQDICLRGIEILPKFSTLNTPSFIYFFCLPPHVNHPNHSI